jgi:hypothetical protein
MQSILSPHKTLVESGMTVDSRYRKAVKSS